MFAYNGTDDRLELCLEPHGHFPMEPNIEQKILDSGSLQTSHLVGSGGDQAAGGRKSFGKKCQQAHVPFSGQGHSMLSSSENISMPHDLDMAPHGHKVSKLSHYSGSLPHPDSIQEEEDEQNAAVAAAMDMEPTFKRVGPGCTVLDTDGGGEKLHNDTTPDAFRTLASQIREIVARTETDLQEEEEEGARAEVREAVGAVGWREEGTWRVDGGILGGGGWREGHWELLGGGRDTGSCCMEGGLLRGVRWREAH